MIKSTFLAISLFFSVSAHAIVSVDSLHLGKKKQGFYGDITTSLDGSYGNSERIRLQGDGTLNWKLANTLYYLSLSTAYGKSLGLENQNESFLHARRIANITPSFAWEIFSQLERDKFASLRLRGLAGGGIRLLLMQRRPDQAFFVGIGSFYSHELIDDSEQSTESDIKGNLYLIYKKQLTENAIFSNTLYAQPVLNNYQDFRILENMGLKIKISETLALKLDIEVRHDSRPPVDVENTDIKYKTGIEYNF